MKPLSDLLTELAARTMDRTDAAHLRAAAQSLAEKDETCRLRLGQLMAMREQLARQEAIIAEQRAALEQWAAAYPVEHEAAE